jgi:hypothetical protein
MWKDQDGVIEILCLFVLRYALLYLKWGICIKAVLNLRKPYVGIF